MSKYEPLQSHLGRLTQSEAPMSFGDIERILGFRLPASARQHQAWWSNNESGNVAVKAWRRAGRRTARVDLQRERVVFVRDGDASASQLPKPFLPARDEVVIPTSVLPLIVRSALERVGGISADAMVALMTDGALLRRKRVLDDLAAGAGPTSDVSSLELLREARDERDVG